METSITIYEANKQLMKNEHPIDPINFNRKIIEIEKTLGYNKYYMLLCHDRRDYSVFHITNKEDFAKKFKITLQNRGIVLRVDAVENEKNAYQIWIRDTETNENYLYFFFDYSFGIIEA